MKTHQDQLTRPFFLLLTILFLLPLTGFSQGIQQADSSDIKLRNAAREIMTSTESCALISLDAEGRPRVRAMDPFDPDADFTVWFGTNANSRKVEQINNDPRVTLYYLEDNDAGYVMIYGTAQLLNNEALKNKWWKAEWEAFYPEGKEDYRLIKVIPEWMEVVSYTYNIHGNPETWEPQRVVFEY